TGLEYTARRGLTYGRRYTYAALAGEALGRIGRPSRRVSVHYAPAPAEPEHLVVEPRESAVRLSWGAPPRFLDGSAITEPLTYQVLRASSPAADPPPGSPPLSEPTFTDSALEN